jgi:LemA protein
MRFNRVAQTFNTTRDTFPTVIIVGLFGARFNEKSYFQSQPGAENAPQVKF